MVGFGVFCWHGAGTVIASSSRMRRLRSGPDPLLLLILASVGIANATGCGGQSLAEGDSPEASGGDSMVGGSGGTGEVTGGVGGAGGSTGGVGAGPSEGPVGCLNPTFPLGEETGYVLCEQGFYHRSEAGRCEQTPLRDGDVSDALAPSCVTDADCAELPNGRCYGGQPPFGASSCVSSCETDEDCAADHVCFCGTTANLCVPSNCKSDADCGGNLLCASYVIPVNACSSTSAFACQLPSDDCTTRCPTGQQCKVNVDADPISRTCSSQLGTGGTCGRPFLVAGTERLAAPAARGDWQGGERAVPELSALTATERLALATHWQAAALMEHASIAAFARFTLELLALGAPASLVAEATAATRDEQRHATTCFTLASTFAGSPLGPGPLPVRDCLASVELESVAVTTFLEGCIGETIAAVEARELALTAADPMLRQTLACITEDEARHALLAWSFLRFALERGGRRLAARIADAWHAETERRVEHPPAAAVLSPERELALGLPSPDFRKEVRRRVLHEIVKPCLDALTRRADLEGTRHELSRVA